jgi:hypothetical protein
MADVIDPLLNDAVDLYVQAVDYRWIPTSQILARSMPKSEKLYQNSEASCYRRQIPAKLKLHELHATALYLPR